MQVTTIRSGGCLSYVLLDGTEAAVIDPARDIQKYVRQVAEAGAKLRFVIDTHTHADHLSGARMLADASGARLVMSAAYPSQWRAAEGRADALGIGDILRENAGVKVEHPVKDGDTIEIGRSGIEFRDAPGHTADSLLVRSEDRLFTGDTLLIGQTGRCDLPGGDGGALYDTLNSRVAALPDETFIYPGHDYDGQTVTALGFERVNNRFLKPRSRADFVAFLATAFPTLTGAGMQCGASAAGDCGTAAGAPSDPLRDRVAGFMDAYFFAASRPENELAASELHAAIGSGRRLCVLDVREPAEFATGHVTGAVNLSVQKLDGLLAQIPASREDEIVTVCGVGRRSGWAAMFLRVAGYTRVRSLSGGMASWRKQGLPVE